MIITDDITLQLYNQNIIVDNSVLNKDIIITLPIISINSTGDNYNTATFDIAKIDKTDYTITVRTQTGYTLNNGDTNNSYEIGLQNNIAKIFVDSATSYRRL